jgi:hypothetical protein
VERRGFEAKKYSRGRMPRRGYSTRVHHSVLPPGLPVINQVLAIFGWYVRPSNVQAESLDQPRCAKISQQLGRIHTSCADETSRSKNTARHVWNSSNGTSLVGEDKAKQERTVRCMQVSHRSHFDIFLPSIYGTGCT